MYAIILSTPIINNLLQENKEEQQLLTLFNNKYNIETPTITKLDYVWFISNDINLATSIKDYFEKIDNTEIIEAITLTCPDELNSLNLTEKFEIIEIDETYWDYLNNRLEFINGIRFSKFENKTYYAPKNNNEFINFICIEGINNAYYQNGKENTIKFHNEYYDNAILNNIRQYFNNIQNII